MSLSLARALLNTDPDPLVVVDGQARIVSLNVAAQRLANARSLEPGDIFRLESIPAAAAFNDRLADLTRTDRPLPDTAPLHIPGDPPLTLTFRRLELAGRPLALVRMKEPSAALEDRCAAFTRSYGLGDAEARLLRALIENRTLEDFCRREGLQLRTERTRLRTLYRLVGVTRPSSLVVAVMTQIAADASPPASSSERPPPEPQSEPASPSDASAPRIPLPHPSAQTGIPRPPLPSFTALKALEAFVRLGSQTAAALELRTNPSNIGRHIDNLEIATGLTLTQGSRLARRPTADGLALAAAAAAAFDKIHAAVPAVTLTARRLSVFVKARSAAERPL